MPILPFYAESVEQFPPGFDRAGLLVVKSHIPSRALVSLTNFVRGTIFLTVREPRDAVASLMQRFGHPFESCIRDVAAGAARMVELARADRPLVLRYEDRFFERRQTLGRVYRRLGLAIPKAVEDRIFRGLSADRVRKKIATLADRGTFGQEVDPDRFDPRTHWHPGHVGDGKTGKYADILGPDMQRAVLETMREYCAAFGYPSPKRLTAGRSKSAAKRARDDRGSGIRQSNRLS